MLRHCAHCRDEKPRPREFKGFKPCQVQRLHPEHYPIHPVSRDTLEACFMAEVFHVVERLRIPDHLHGR